MFNFVFICLEILLAITKWQKQYHFCLYPTHPPISVIVIIYKCLNKSNRNSKRTLVNCNMTPTHFTFWINANDICICACLSNSYMFCEGLNFRSFYPSSILEENLYGSHQNKVRIWIFGRRLRRKKKRWTTDNKTIMPRLVYAIGSSFSSLFLPYNILIYNSFIFFISIFLCLSNVAFAALEKENKT